NITIDYEPVTEVDASTWPLETTTFAENTTSLESKSTSGTKTSPYPNFVVIFAVLGILAFFLRKKK
ncbi:MAG: hypothetical protein ACFFBQ_19740, partial [Promethearchaeota archaeon]